MHETEEHPKAIS